jgi:hypothetical protein
MADKEVEGGFAVRDAMRTRTYAVFKPMRQCDLLCALPRRCATCKTCAVVMLCGMLYESARVGAQRQTILARARLVPYHGLDLARRRPPRWRMPPHVYTSRALAAPSE